jgi:8-oxo-dGTP pyrophosphatase MutT (NUDIX family)
MKSTKNDTINEKSSVGIACVRRNQSAMEILLVKKRYTYSFNKFVNGRYRSDNNQELIKLFGGMTLDEKLDIISLNFTQIWYRIWLNNLQKMSSFYAAKSKFENNFVADKGVRLKRLLSATKTHGELVWEIPKGRKKNRLESDIQCGVREFKEETLIQKKQIKVFLENITYSYISDGTKYTNTYYFAVAKGVLNPRIDITSQEQIGEIAEIKWMSIEAVIQAGSCRRIIPVVKKIFRFIKKHGYC